MNRPENLSVYDELDLKLGIKSSLPHVKGTIALAILLWECADRPAELIYSQQNGDSIVLTDELDQWLVDALSEICEEEQIGFEALMTGINENQLFKSQMEALIVAFELVWKLAKVSFVEDGKAASTERTGGTRYPKKLLYTVNADIIHSLIDSNYDAYIRVLLSWIGFNINADSECEQHMLHLLTALSEEAVFKLTDGNRDVIFNQDSVYTKLLETEDAVDINGDSEAKGSLRVLKSLLSDSMNPYLSCSRGNVSVVRGKRSYLEAYQKRVDMFLRLSATKVIGLEDIDAEDEGSSPEKYEEIFLHSLFGIHIKEKNTALSENNPHICIGWSDLGDLSEIKDKNDLATLYDAHFEKNNRGKGQDIGQIWRFINDVKEGDYVIFAEKSVFHIGRIESDYYFDKTDYEGQSNDYKNTRKVRWLKKNISRSVLSSDLHNSLNTAMSIWSMNDYKSAVSDLLRGVYRKDDDGEEAEEIMELKFETGLTSEYKRNRILFGAPGTGKSYTLNKQKTELLGADNEIDYERVTFHPDYSYANFVGTYKPVPTIDSDGKDAITYEYVPGPFMRVLVNALKSAMTDNPKPYLLIIEEINRANVAAVFGDVFQLLDRNDDNYSEYPIEATEDMKRFLSQELNLPETCFDKIRIPDNMFMWATMNSADQGVFPMDTAFKRRWDFTYIGINDNDENLNGKTVVLGSKSKQKVEWNALRKAINDFLAKQKINEDKQLGPYFISKKISIPENGNEIDSEQFAKVFKNKVIMYLFEDAAKQRRTSIFSGCFDNSNRYSEICKEFDEKGIGIFNQDIQIAVNPEDIGEFESVEDVKA